MALITPAALQRLQILYAQASRKHDLGTGRDERLAYFRETTGRAALASSKDLTAAEGKHLIDGLQASLGIAETAPSMRQRKSTKQRQKEGTEGRHDQIHAETTMLDGTEDVFRHIRVQMDALRMDEAALKAFLRGPYGPNDRRDTIRTLGEANRVYYALKRQVERGQGRYTARASLIRKGAAA